MLQTLFISDLHLDPARPHITAACFEFLKSNAHGTDAIYILGDLFELWIGDDDDDPFAAACVAALRAATRHTPIFLLHGNRDFLLSTEFAERTGVRLLPDPTVINLYGKATVLTHGDALCTADRAYQALRAMVRSPLWQRDQLAKPIDARRAFGAALRAQSQAANANKAEYIMDVDEHAVRAILLSHNVRRIIHGHTHRPGVHRLQVAEDTVAERCVLGDWSTYGWLLRVTPTHTHLERFVI